MQYPVHAHPHGSFTRFLQTVPSDGSFRRFLQTGSLARTFASIDFSKPANCAANRDSLNNSRTTHDPQGSPDSHARVPVAGFRAYPARTELHPTPARSRRPPHPGALRRVARAKCEGKVEGDDGSNSCPREPVFRVHPRNAAHVGSTHVRQTRLRARVPNTTDPRFAP